MSIQTNIIRIKAGANILNQLNEEFEEGLSAHLEPITLAQQIEKIFRVLHEIIAV